MQIDGMKIAGIRTLKSMYDGDNVQVMLDDGSLFRMPTSTILQMVNEFTFTSESKRVHNYLVEAIPKHVDQEKESPVSDTG